MSQVLRRTIKTMVEPRTKELAYSLCRRYLDGEWTRVSYANFAIEKIDGGLTNHLFLCSLPNTTTVNKTYGNKVLLRLYGMTYSEMSETRFRMMEECLICGLLANKKMGPQLYGIFPEGRLEQYWPGMRSLTNVEVREPQISQQIAEHMGTFHKLILPLNKEPTWHWTTMMSFVDQIKIICFDDPMKQAELEKIKETYDFNSEIKFLRQLVEKTNSPVVFCHNDVQPGNLLVKATECLSTARLKLIDFEYSSYNYRGFDIGNHFQEWMHNYNYTVFPYFDGNLNEYPSHTQKTHFVRRYLKTTNDTEEIDEGEIEKVIKEADRLTLLSHFYWALMSIVQASQSTINFGYLEYAIWRLECYDHFKYFALDDVDHTSMVDHDSTRNRIVGLNH